MSGGTRKFARGLTRPGTASKRRESATQAVRESYYSSGSELLKSSLADPVDYEVQVLRKQSEILSDPQRNLLEFPADDFEATQQPQDRRTVIDSVPDGADKEVSSLMVKECIKTYQNNWHLIINKYGEYGENYLKLPKHGEIPPQLREVVYEVDEQAEYDEDNLQNNLMKEGVTKRGWLYKAPSYTGASISIRQFKRRFFDLKQMPDSMCILNYYKDEKTSRDPKGAVYLDSCIGAHLVSLTTKARKHAFEIRMQDQSCHLLAADSEQEANDWISTINQALQSSIEAQLQHEEQKNAHLESEAIKPSSTMESLQSSMHPELVKYSKETDQKNVSARREGRVPLMNIYPDFQERYLKAPIHHSSLPPPPIKHGKHRVMVQCKTISFNLRGVVIDGADEPKTAIEPFFVTLCLYDVNQMKKISSDIHVDLNHDLVRKMIPERDFSARKPSSPSGSMTSNSSEVKTGEPTLPSMVKRKWVAYPKNCVFNVSKPHPEIYLVARIEKVLQGSIKSCAQPYMKSDGDTAKTALKVLKHAKVACQRLGHYRMPFAWTAKPLFADCEGTIDRTPFGEYVYKQESAKLSEEYLLKYLTDFKKPDKLTKLEDIPCTLNADFFNVPSDIPSLLSSSLVPIKPYSEKSEAILEVDEFLPMSLQDQYMHMEYVNHYYIYPRALKYDNQKSFAKARNIAVVVEFKDSDGEGAVPLRSFYNRPGQEVFVNRVSAAVLHHDETPEFYEEFKLALPAQLHSGHHLLFSFYHVIVDTSGKKKDIIKTEIGHAWLPLLTKDGQVWCDERTLSVCANIPPGYLSQDPMSYPRGQHVGPELKWVDGGKPLFRLSTRLVSSVYTTDPHLHNFFGCCQQSLGGTASDQDLVKYLKTLLAAEDRALIQFLPTLLNQLFRLLALRKSSKDVKTNCIKSLVHIVTVCHQSENHKNLLKQYIKYMFVTEPWQDYKSFTVHEELVTSMTELLRPTVTDFLTLNKILKHLSFFLEIVAKSMAQHLIMAKKLKQKRNERFPVSFQHAIQSLLTTTVPHIIGKWKTNYEGACNANLSIAHFVKSCFTFVDRGFVFKLINHYMENFNPGDPKVLFEFKFEFLRAICDHEHCIPLNLPFAAHVKKNKTDYAYSLSEEYCRNHFLAGHLLQSLNAAMYEPPEIRSIVIDTVMNLIAKHTFDSRYNTQGHQSRIAALYLPFIRIVLDNVGRFSFDNDNSYTSRDDLENTPSKNAADIGMSYSPKNDRYGGGSLRMSKPPDLNTLSAISSPGLMTKGSRGSFVANENQATAALDRVVEKNLSLTSATRYASSERYDISESRSLLICFLQILKNIPPDALKGFWMQSTTEEQIDFFDIIEVCLHQFRYIGKRHPLHNIRLPSLKHNSSYRFGSISKKNSKSLTLPVRIRPGTAHQYKNISILAEPMITQGSGFMSEHDVAQNSLLEANLASEVGMIVLDVLGDFARHFKKYLQREDGDNSLMQRISSVFLLFLQISQSEYVLKHAFASLRLFMCKFQSALFRGKADLCASLIYYALKCCNSRLASTRAEACALLYLLMRTNFEFSSGRNFVRSHLQMIKAVSQLISEEVVIGNARFQNSLAVINAYAQSDKGMQHSVFHIEVKDLTKRIRTVLMATAAMKEHKDDPEMLVDLQYSLAKSYAATPELRKTWLESMAKIHEKNKNYSEAAMCYIHIAALVAEYLKRKDIKDNARTGTQAMRNSSTSETQAQNSTPSEGAIGFMSRIFSGVGAQQQLQTNGDGSQDSTDHGVNTLFLTHFISESKSVINKGCSAFRSVSPNVEKEESAIKEDHGMQDVQYNEDVLTELLHRCVTVLEQAERYELMSSVYKMIIPFYEKNRDFMGLVNIYSTLKDAYTKIVQVNQSGKRMLGTYFRVAFYGQQYFDEEDGREYIYKEPKLTQLSEISMRLQHMYGVKFGQENIKLIQESNKVDRKDVDPKYAYIQVTYVKPFFDEQELEHRQTPFERAHNLKNFVFETPFTPAGKARGGIEEQWKRKTILTTAHSFPYVKKRIMVTSQRGFELKPIEVALDAMEAKCSELDELVESKTVDLKKLQLRLQGSVSVQVNAGPLAYAKAFLEDNKISSHPANTVDRLRKAFRRFVGLCGRALDINEQMISSDQHDYHNNLRSCYYGMADELSHIMHEQLVGDDDDAISLTASSMGGEAENVFTAISNFTSPQSAPGSLAKRTSTANMRPMSAGPKKLLQGVVSDVSNV